MRRIARLTSTLFLCCFLLGAGACQGNGWTGRWNVYDIAGGRMLGGTETLEALAQHRVLVVGEHHTDEDHHRAQLFIIEVLAASGRPIAVGLEMFREESQGKLDQWVSGEMSEGDFQDLYMGNWGYPWRLYQPIFLYARERSIPLVALNVTPEITRQVAAQGFESLSPEQRVRIGNVTCRVDQAYREYIRRAFGSHAHGSMNFEYFCEAQLLWDTAMAVNAMEYLRVNPDRTMVILAGMAHAWRWGIPRQITSLANVSVATIVPEFGEPDLIETLKPGDADYILLKR